MCVIYKLMDLSIRYSDELEFRDLHLPYVRKSTYGNGVAKEIKYHDVYISPYDKDITSTLTIKYKENFFTDVSNVRKYTMEDVHTFYVYSDGASYNNGGKAKDKPQYGSYGTIIKYNDKVISRKSYAHKDWTNNIGELSGAIMGLVEVYKYVEDNSIPKDKVNIILTTDSQYVAYGLTDWMTGWIAKKFKGVANDKLWKKMMEYVNMFNVYVQWVRGHTGAEDRDIFIYNDECDRMATAVLKEKLLEDGVIDNE